MIKTMTFKNWTLTELDKTFGLTQIWQSDLLDKWQSLPCEISENEQKIFIVPKLSTNALRKTSKTLRPKPARRL